MMHRLPKVLESLPVIILVSCIFIHFGCDSVGLTEPEIETPEVLTVWFEEVPDSLYSYDQNLFIGIHAWATVEPEAVIAWCLWANDQLQKCSDAEIRPRHGHRWYFWRDSAWEVRFRVASATQVVEKLWVWEPK